MNLLQKKARQQSAHHSLLWFSEDEAFFGSTAQENNTMRQKTPLVLRHSGSTYRKQAKDFEETIQKELSLLVETWGEKKYLLDSDRLFVASNILDEIYQLCKKDQIKKAVLHLYRNVNKLLCQGQLKDVSSVLRAAQLERLPTELLVGLLRITFPARQKIEGWENACQKVSSELQRRGLDVSILLVGLPY